MTDVIDAALAVQTRAAAEGFDWPDVSGVWDKVYEELEELQAAAQEPPSREAEEWGDVLFTLLNLARHRQINPQAALKEATQRFARRYAVVEAALSALPPRGHPERLAAMERCWQMAKRAAP